MNIDLKFQAHHRGMYIIVFGICIAFNWNRALKTELLFNNKIISLRFLNLPGNFGERENGDIKWTTSRLCTERADSV